MKLKEIKPGMIIHCNNKEEWRMLFGELVKTYSVYDWMENMTSDNCICVGNNMLTWGYLRQYEKTSFIVEFSDLIIPKLSAEELVPILTDICKTFVDEECNGCPLNGLEHVANGNECPFTFKDYSKVVEICAQWKVDHEKKEPEIEWVYKAVADIVCCNEMEFFDTEEAAIEWCERRTIETGNNHAYVRVCRKKGGVG